MKYRHFFQNYLMMRLRKMMNKSENFQSEISIEKLVDNENEIGIMN